MPLVNAVMAVNVFDAVPLPVVLLSVDELFMVAVSMAVDVFVVAVLLLLEAIVVDMCNEKLKNTQAHMFNTRHSILFYYFILFYITYTTFNKYHFDYC